MDMDVYIDFGGKKTIKSKIGDTIDVPDGCSPVFPESHELFGRVKALFKDGKHEGAQIDWGSWYVMLTKKEISALFEGVDLSMMNNYFARALRLIEDLPDEGKYKVVASEY